MTTKTTCDYSADLTTSSAQRAAASDFDGATHICYMSNFQFSIHGRMNRNAVETGNGVRGPGLTASCQNFEPPINSQTSQKEASREEAIREEAIREAAVASPQDEDAAILSRMFRKLAVSPSHSYQSLANKATREMWRGSAVEKKRRGIRRDPQSNAS